MSLIGAFIGLFMPSPAQQITHLRVRLHHLAEAAMPYVQASGAMEQPVVTTPVEHLRGAMRLQEDAHQAASAIDYANWYVIRGLPSAVPLSAAKHRLDQLRQDEFALIG